MDPTKIHKISYSLGLVYNLCVSRKSVKPYVIFNFVVLNGFTLGERVIRNSHD